MKRQELVMMKGLPASGKSTYARELVKKGYARVNKDDMRAMIDGSKWSKNKEKNILKIRDLIIQNYLTDGRSVVVDDTNFALFHQVTLGNLAVELGVKFRVEYIEVNPRECVKRDLARENSVGSDVIMDMYFKYVDKPIVYTSDDERRSCYIFDIDGTIAKHEGRSPFDMSRVGEDKPREAIMDILKNLARDFEIVLFSGRSDICKKETLEWLKRYDIRPNRLCMRREGDVRKDSLVKSEMYEELAKTHKVLAVFDDRDQVVDMWRSKGLNCLQVNYGAF